MRKNVLLLETISDDALATLQGEVNIIASYNAVPSPEVLYDQQIHAVITRGKGKINKALMDACPGLQVAARCGVGLDNVDVEEATARNIKVVNAPGANAATIAEHAISLMLMLVRDMYQSVLEVKRSNWNWRNQYSGDELHGKTLGILGMGNIGERVAKLADAFGMNVLYWSRSAKNVPYSITSFEDVLQQSDVVSLHVPFTKETGTLIGAEQLAMMKHDSFLINTARGALVDKASLIKALDEEMISGYAADVLAEEPPAENDPLVNHPRTLITPHSGSLTASTYQQMCMTTVKNVVAILAGEKPEEKSVFNRKALQETFSK
jgi:D-3-phosphoglycerate dehydrogenase